MPNIIDYANIADEDFTERPITDADALILACLAYERMPDIVPPLDFVEEKYGTRLRRLRNASWRHPIASVRNIMHAEFKGPTLEEIAHTLSPEDFDVTTGHTGLGDPKLTEELFNTVARSPRLCDIRVSAYVELFDAEHETQFSAQTMRLQDGTLVVVFRGTDDSLVGWKEDFNMSYQYPVPAQQSAAAYVQRIAAIWDGPIVLTGHSKGGNLAIYAAMNASESVDQRITRIYSMDGPGFLDSVAHSAAYDHIRTRIRKIIPDASIVGMILHTPEPTQIVVSDQTGVMQHLAFSWQMQDQPDSPSSQTAQAHTPSGSNHESAIAFLREGRFLHADSIAPGSQEFNTSLCDWMDTLSPQQLKRTVDAMFGILAASGVQNLTAMVSVLPKAIPNMIGSFTGLSDEDRRNLTYFTNLLFRASLPRNILRIPWFGANR